MSNINKQIISNLKSMENAGNSSPFTKYGLALAYWREKQHDEAEKYFQLLLELHPNYLPTYYQFGKFLEEKNDFERVQLIYKNGIELAEQQKDWKTKRELEEANEWIND